MGEAKRRRDAIARGEPDPGPSAPTPTTKRGRGSVAMPHIAGSDPAETARLRSEMHAAERKLDETARAKRLGAKQ